jgi:hypothetical protein
MSEQSTAIVLRSANRVNDTTFDRIWKFYYEKSDIELKEKEEEIRTRLVNIWGYLSDILTDRQAVQAHVKWCEDMGYRIKERQAYEDLRYAKMLFGDRTKQTREAQRAMVNEWLIWGIKKAKEDQSLKAYALLIMRYNALNNLEGDQAGQRAEKPAITINFSADPEVLKKQQEELRRRSEAANATDITHEEV